MMALNEGHGSRPPPRRPDKINNGRQDVRQRNDYQSYARNNYQQPNEMFAQRFHPGQHERFGQNYHQGHHERYGGPYNSNFNSPSNQHFNSSPRYHHPPNHSRDFRNVPPPFLHDQQYIRGNHPRVHDWNQRDFRPHTSGYPNRSGRAYDHYEETDERHTIDTLVEVLSYSSTLSAAIHNIERNNRIPPNVVLRTAESRKDIFTINENNQNKILRLDPKLALCLKHYSANGCSSSICNDLHMCRNYIHGRCQSKEPCFHGHELKTNHNIPILSNLHLSSLSNECLLRVIRNSCKYVDYLEVCHHYNTEKGCKYARCRKLHICKKFVTDIKDCTGCSLNHDVLDRQCLGLLEFHGVPTNETPRDILVQIRSLSELQTTSAPKNKGKMSQNTEPKRNAKTYKSTDIFGDEKITEICIHSIGQKCEDYQNGCKYLHSKNPFHWQVSYNERWYNIPIFQTKALENAFCEVSKSSANMTGLGKSCTKELIEVLGTDPWEADFTNMKLRSANRELTIRRLSTPPASVKDSPNATVFQWYFKDENDKWIKYGDADSLNRKDMTSSITSNDIEKQFLKDPQSSVSFSNTHYTYTIDFSTMKQVNETTKKAREVRRRPTQPAKNVDGDRDKKPHQEPQRSDVPSHWKPMDQGSIDALVDLDSSTDEYREVSERLFITIPTANIQSIQRLQNPYLWDTFQSRKKHLTQRDSRDHLHVNKLFYGVDPQELGSIRLENIDWRRRGPCDMKYGQGNYFSNSAAVALKNSTKDAGGHKYLILASVIIGDIVRGEPSLTRPPLDLSRNVHYDTAVDDMDAPTFFIKFESNEYYPSYIIKLQTSA